MGSLLETMMNLDDEDWETRLSENIYKLTNLVTLNVVGVINHQPSLRAKLRTRRLTEEGVKRLPGKDETENSIATATCKIELSTPYTP